MNLDKVTLDNWQGCIAEEMTVTPQSTADAVIGGTPTVHTYWDDDDKSHVGLLSSKNDQIRASRPIRRYL